MPILTSSMAGGKPCRDSEVPCARLPLPGGAAATQHGGMSSAAPATRLFLDVDLAAGSSFELPPAQAHYLRNVLRLDTGDRVAFFNGRDGEWLGRIAAADRRRSTVTIVELLRAQTPDPDLWLLFAPI